MFHAKKYFVFIFTLFWSVMSLAQDNGKIVKSHGVGECVLYDDMTPNQAMAKAKEEAKFDATRKVCPQKVTIYDMIRMWSKGEYYGSKASIVTSGTIIEIKNEKTTKVTRDDKTVYICELDAKIQITTIEPDYSYNATVETDKTRCYDHDGLNSINVNVSKDSYVKMFYMTESFDRTENIKIDEDFVKANKKTNIISGDKLTLEIDNGDNSEIFHFAVILTKDDIPYKEGTDFDIWYSNIPNDKKTISFFSVEVRKRNN